MNSTSHLTNIPSLSNVSQKTKAMRQLLFLLLAIGLCNCTPKPTALSTSAHTENTTSYLIGYTGGWGGGPAYKLENGKLYESLNQHNPGNADATVNDNTFKTLKSATGLQAMQRLAEDFKENVMSEVPPGFQCPEMAYDGVCPYFIIVKDGNIRGWTLSEKGTYPDSFKTFMEEVGEALTEI